MALPTDILLPVGGQFDLRDPLEGRFLRVASPAEIPAGGLRRLDDPRRNPVPGRHPVARGALELNVVGDGERPRDFAVARRTLSWDCRRLRVVWVVAGEARLHRVVRHGADHGEPPRPRGVECVADGTELPFPGGGRLDIVRIFRVDLRGTVARLARQVPVIPPFLFRNDLFVALRAGHGARILDRLRVLLLYRVRPLDLRIFKPGRNDELHNDEGADDYDREHDHKPHQGVGQLLQRFLHGRGDPPKKRDEGRRVGH